MGSRSRRHGGAGTPWEAGVPVGVVAPPHPQAFEAHLGYHLRIPTRSTATPPACSPRKSAPGSRRGLGCRCWRDGAPRSPGGRPGHEPAVVAGFRTERVALGVERGPEVGGHRAADGAELVVTRPVGAVEVGGAGGGGGGYAWMRKRVKKRGYARMRRSKERPGDALLPRVVIEAQEEVTM